MPSSNTALLGGLLPIFPLDIQDSCFCNMPLFTGVPGREILRSSARYSGFSKSTGATGVAHPLDRSVAEVLASGVAQDSVSAVGSDSTQACLVTAAASSVGRERRLRRYGQRRYKTVPLTRPNHRCWAPANGSAPGLGRTTWLAWPGFKTIWTVSRFQGSSGWFVGGIQRMYAGNLGKLRVFSGGLRGSLSAGLITFAWSP